MKRGHVRLYQRNPPQSEVHRAGLLIPILDSAGRVVTKLKADDVAGIVSRSSGLLVVFRQAGCRLLEQSQSSTRDRYRRYDAATADQLVLASLEREGVFEQIDKGAYVRPEAIAKRANGRLTFDNGVKVLTR